MAFSFSVMVKRGIMEMKLKSHRVTSACMMILQACATSMLHRATWMYLRVLKNQCSTPITIQVYIMLKPSAAFKADWQYRPYTVRT